MDVSKSLDMTREILDRQRATRRRRGELKRQAEINVAVRFYEKYYSYKLKTERFLGDLVPQEDFEKFEKMSNLITEINKTENRKVSKNYCRFVGVSFPPDLSVIEIQRRFSNVLKKKWLKDTPYHYVFEQRGKIPADIGKGIHIHLLFKNPKQSKRQSQIIREFSSTLKISKNFIDVKQGTQDDYTRFFAYINGDKQDESKQDAVKMDVFFRRNNNLRNIYSNGSSS